MRLARRWGTILQERWPVVPLVLGIIGVLLGWVGFGQYRPDASTVDHIYMSLQLLVLEGPTSYASSPDSLPWELSIARLLCAAVPGSTLLFLALRLLANRVDWLVGLLAQDHIVIIGATSEACQLAVAEASSRIDHRDSKRRVVVISTVESMLANDLRARGVVVTSEPKGRAFQRLLKGSTEVVIMEATDSIGLRRFREIRTLMNSDAFSRLAKRPAVRLVVESTELARMQRSYEDFRPDSGCTVISAAEAVAEKVTSVAFFPPLIDGRDDHILVLGEGEYAMQVAILAFHRRFVPGRRMTIDLVVGPDDTWQHDVEAELPNSFPVATDTGQFRIHQPLAHRAEYLSELISDLCGAGNEQHQIFIVGLPDERALPIAHEIASRIPQPTIVSLLQKDFGSANEFEGNVREQGKWHIVRVGEVLTEIDALRLTVAERLAAQLCEEFQRFSDLPGKLGRSDVIQAYVRLTETERRKWSQELARDLLVALRDSGVVLQQTDSRKLASIGGAALKAGRSCLSSHLARLDPERTLGSIPGTVFRVISQLPDLLSRFGMFLRDENASATTLSNEEVNKLAEKIHTAYLETIKSSRVDVSTLPYYIEWSALNDEQREKNRRPARDIEPRLLNIGLVMVPLSSPGSRALELDSATIESLAEDEHEAWMLTQLAHGYRFGGTREEDRRIHPQMIPYEQLSENEKQKDRDVVREMGRLLESIGWGVVPQPN
jgi:hypothetical protein